MNHIKEFLFSDSFGSHNLILCDIKFIIKVIFNTTFFINVAGMEFKNVTEITNVNSGKIRHIENNRIDFLGLWEQLHNPEFKPIEFYRFRKEAG